MVRLLFCFLLLISACEKSVNSSLSQSAEPVISKKVPVEALNNFTTQFMELVNNHRVDLGIMPLIHDESLGLIAQHHSEDMVSGIVPFGHTGFSERCAEARTILGGGNLCAENVAMGQNTPLAVFTAWMNSPGHRANIEQPRATHTGFGYQKSQTGSYYWTQIFIELI